MRIQFKREYAYAHRGVKIERFSAGQILDNPPADLARMALADGAAINPDEDQEEKPAKRIRKG